MRYKCGKPETNILLVVTFSCMFLWPTNDVTYFPGQKNHL